jgi:hypothetical protein
MARDLVTVPIPASTVSDNRKAQNPAGLCQTSYPGRGSLRTGRRGEVYHYIEVEALLYISLYILYIYPEVGG